MKDAQAEHFDSKLRSLGSPVFSLVFSHKLFHLRDILFLLLAGDVSILDANSEVWGQKVMTTMSFALAVGNNV